MVYNGSLSSRLTHRMLTTLVLYCVPTVPIAGQERVRREIPSAPALSTQEQAQRFHLRRALHFLTAVYSE